MIIDNAHWFADGEDFDTISAGNMPGCLLIEIIDDLVLEGNQTFTVMVVVGDISAVIPAPQNITIIDNDGKYGFDQTSYMDG